jgi:hypothetical protein
LGPFFERFFILGGPRGTRQKNFKQRTQTESDFCIFYLSTCLSLTIRVDPF